MEERYVKTEPKAEGVVVVTLDRPDALNALNAEVLGELHRVFYRLAHDASVRVVILTGVGKTFVAGADIKEMADFGPAQASEFSQRGQRVFSQIEDFPWPVIAAVNGFALGGGCELVMACDYRVAGEKAKLGQPEVNLGVTPGFGGTQRLTRLVGRPKAKYLLFTGEVIPAEKALALGLVDEVVPQDALLERCLEIARTIAAKGPVAVRLCKEAVNQGVELDLHRGLAFEAEVFARTFATEDQKEGMRAFVDKRPAVFRNR
ncbi:MAG: enoyl-CoA hydratase/isomerase family protein [Acidobacteria bacterium]|nr:enoyl-CoA hydratase/isomerase family protein [Acidobacteriota bacterium]